VFTVLTVRRLLAVAAIAITVALVAPPGAAYATPGPWRIADSPNLGSGHNHLQESSCFDTSRCVAVGYNQDPNTGLRRSISTVLGAGTWKLVTVPARGIASNSLWNVSCPSKNRCYAVGYYFDIPAGYYKTLIATYNGAAWSLVTSPNRGGVDNYLFGVDCFDTTHCVAVGRSADPNTQVARTLAINLSGSTWSIVATPNRPSASNLLSDVSCGDITHCVAVGYTINADTTVQSLIIGRNRESWGIRLSVDRPSTNNVLRDVSCPTTTTCVAVGASDPSTGPDDEVTLIQTLTAGTWVLAPSTNRAGYDNHLWAVSCSSETQCVAAGQSQNETLSRPLIETLSGGTWRNTQPAPYRSGTFTHLYGVSCPTRQCVAAGDYLSTNQVFRTAIMTNSPL
jgi:hypothetical protein